MRVSIVFVGMVVAACSREDGGAVCEIREDGFVTVLINDGGGWPPPSIEVAAAATVGVTSDRLVLTFDDDSVVRLGYDVPGDEAQTFVEGERVWAEVTADGPFWVNSQIELYTLDAAGDRGELRLAAWWGEYALDPIEGWTLDLVDGDCDATSICGSQIGMNLQVTAPGGAQAVLAPGTSTELEGHRVSNGHSTRFVSTIDCTDTPPTWSGVGIVRL